MFLQKVKRVLLTLRDDFTYIFSAKNEITLSDEQYDNYWRIKRGDSDKGASSFQKSRAKVIKKYISPHDNVLDVGCGDCEILKLISEDIPLNVFATDIAPWALKKAEDLGYSYCHIDASNTTALSQLQSFDIVLLLEILEHLKNSEQVLKILLEKTDKYLIFSVPNSGYYAHRIRFFLGKFPAQWIVHPGEHLRFWTFADMNWWLKALNIKSYAVYSYEGLPWLNNIMPSLFAKGIVIAIPKDQNNI